MQADRHREQDSHILFINYRINFQKCIDFKKWMVIIL